MTDSENNITANEKDVSASEQQSYVTPEVVASPTEDPAEYPQTKDPNNKAFVQEFIDRIAPNDALFRSFYSAVNGGKNALAHNVVNEAITLDDAWVLTLEKAIFYIEEIAKRPQKSIRDDEMVVPVERARRTTAKTIRHLSANTRNIANIDVDGTIMPKKVLSTLMEEDLGIYENRFIATLVSRLITFVEKRREDIKGKMNVYDITTIKMHSDFRFKKSNFDLKLAMSVKEPPRNKVLLQKNTELVRRIDAISTRLQILKNTPFMRQLLAMKPVVPPIAKTNLIKMNVNYNNAYKLWLYISGYTNVGYSVAVMDKNVTVDGDYFDDMTILSALSVKALLENEIVRKSYYDKVDFSAPKKKKYKIVRNIELETDFGSDTKTVSDNLVNEFYYVKMREAMQKAAMGDNKPGTVIDEQTLQMSFRRFFKSIQKLNETMFDDVIHEQITPKKTLVRRSPLKVKEEKMKLQKVNYRRHHQLSMLMSEWYEKLLRDESREFVKLEKLKREYNEALDKQFDKKLRDMQRRQKLQKIVEKQDKVEAKAEDYKADLLEAEDDRLYAIEEAKRLKKEEAKKEKELKMLAYLKEKYEN